MSFKTRMEDPNMLVEMSVHGTDCLKMMFGLNLTTFKRFIDILEVFAELTVLWGGVRAIYDLPLCDVRLCEQESRMMKI